MADKQKEIEDFAYKFGEHCLKFSNHVNYDNFVKQLVADIVKEFDVQQTSELQNYIQRLQENRQKEEKNGDVDYFIVRHNKDSSDDDSSDMDNEADILLDFM